MTEIILRDRSKGKNTLFTCICHECGNDFTVWASRYYKLKGNVDCGCLTGNHNQTKTRLYSIWCNMKNRCYNKKIQKYKNYGLRGITVCDEWKSDYRAFYKWAYENGYNDSLTIERIDVNKNYEPKNCKWICAKEQARNKTNNVFVTVNGITKCFSWWAEALDINTNNVSLYVRTGKTTHKEIVEKHYIHDKILNYMESGKAK